MHDNLTKMCDFGYSCTVLRFEMPCLIIKSLKGLGVKASIEEGLMEIVITRQDNDVSPFENIRRNVLEGRGQSTAKQFHFKEKIRKA